MASLAQTWQRVTRNDQLLLFCLAVVVGTAAGYGALAFRLLYSGIQILFYGHGTEHLASWASTLPWWHIVAAPTAGGLLIGLFTRYVMPGRRPQGVPEVMEASALRNGRMSLNAGLGAAFISASAIGCGASVGREGPIVHLGATLASFVAKRLHLSSSLAKTPGARAARCRNHCTLDGRRRRLATTRTICIAWLRLSSSDA
jgi:CIC family chloride channel protein